MAPDREVERGFRMVEVTVRFAIDAEEIGPVEHYLRAILAASGAELLEWRFHPANLSDKVDDSSTYSAGFAESGRPHVNDSIVPNQNITFEVEDPLYNPEGGI